MNGQMTNLGSDHPPGRLAYGHHDFTQTACPGQRMIEQIDQIAFIESEANEMRLIRVGGGHTWLEGGGAKQWVRDLADVQPFITAGRLTATVVPVDAGYLATLKDIGPVGKPLPSGVHQHSVEGRTVAQ